MKNQRFKYLEHTADIKFQSFGKTLEQVFENSAFAMFEAMHKGKVKSLKTVKIKVQGIDIESLLYNFLEELLFLLDTEHLFLSEISNLKINKKYQTLTADITGDHAKNYEIHTDIKAITYNDMFVKQDKKSKTWTAQVVLDV